MQQENNRVAGFRWLHRLGSMFRLSCICDLEKL